MPLNWTLVFSCLILTMLVTINSLNKMKMMNKTKKALKNTEYTMKW